MKKFLIGTLLMGVVSCATPTPQSSAPVVHEPTPCEKMAAAVEEVDVQIRAEASTWKDKLEYCHLIQDGDDNAAIGVVVGHLEISSPVEPGKTMNVEKSILLFFAKDQNGKWDISQSHSLYTLPIPAVHQDPTQEAPDGAHDVNSDSKAL